MKISHNWLKEFVDVESSPQQLSDTLNMLGIEVESFVEYASIFNRFVIGKVLTREKHPKADKLSVCTVFDGSEEHTIVCGAPNVEAGQTVVVALPGAIVPNGGFEIGKRVLRGVESNGMICSKAELNIEDDHSGIWVLPDDTPVGMPFADAMSMNDTVYEISITPNRADALSHCGIARVVAAFENKSMKQQEHRLQEGSQPLSVSVQIEDSEKCPRYAARVIRNVKVGQSPDWLRQRLEAVGLRPKNVVVDVTNYVLMEYGQPLHAFDYDTVKDQSIVVRRAKAGETYTTLDGKERTLDGDMLMICDTEKSLAIGGVMGGDNSSVRDSTTNILLESAYFQPSSIRKTGRSLAISSDASYRFERGVDVNNVIPALNRAAQLIAELAGGDIEQGIADVYPQPIPERVLNLRFDRARKIIGIEISNEEMTSLLQRLQFVVVSVTDSAIDVRVPSFRVDIHAEIDLIEEIAILYNYDNITVQNEATVSFGESRLPEKLSTQPLRNSIRQYLSLNGFAEIVTQNQVDPASAALLGIEAVHIANPLGEELSVMRSSLLPSMLRVLRHNERNGARMLALYEVGKTFRKAEQGSHSFIEGISESEELCIALHGFASQQEWFGEERRYDFYDAKGVVEALMDFLGIELQWGSEVQHPMFGSNALAIKAGNTAIGVVGNIQPAVLKHADIENTPYVISLDLSLLYSLARAAKQYKAVSLFPFIQRDLSFVTEKKTKADEILQVIRANAGIYFRDARIFDIFEGKSVGENKKSISYAITFASDERTLTDSEADAAINTIIQAVQRSTGATLRT